MLVSRSLFQRIKLLFRDERGGEVLEWALVSGLILAATIAVVGSVAAKLMARWQATADGM